jgi:eukaryotic-like serine/threonine-protein kinase
MHLPEEVQLVLRRYPEFQIGEFNDSGANGYVLVGMHGVLRKKVAIKVYFHGGSDMVHEPELIARINHPNVLKVYDARKLNSECSFFVMPAAGDGDLLSFLAKYNLSLPLAHSLLCQLLSGIAALHAAPNNLVHRDLKPANLLVHDDSLLIGDFGSVRQVSAETGVAPASRHSILYRPPEAFGKDAYFDYASDVYQAGLIGFLLFGGMISENLLEHLRRKERSQVKKLEATADQFTVSKYVDACLQDRIQRGRLIDMGALPCFVPRSIKTILRKALSQTGRYTATCEFLADLNNARAALPDWIAGKASAELHDWKGKDYRICHDGSHYVAMKRRAGAKQFQRDNTVGIAQSMEEVYGVLKVKVGLR